MKFQYVSPQVPAPLIKPYHPPAILAFPPPPPPMAHMSSIPCTTTSANLLHKPHSLSAIEPFQSHLNVQPNFRHRSLQDGSSDLFSSLSRYGSSLHTQPHPSSTNITYHSRHAQQFNGTSVFNPRKISPPILSHTPILTAE